MTQWLLGLELIDGPVLPVSGILTAAILVLIVVVKPRHPWRLLAGALAGAVFGAVAVAGIDVSGIIAISIPGHAAVWAVVGLAGAGAAVAALGSGPRWRIAVAGLAVILSIATGALGVNRAFDITHNLSALLGVQAAGPISLPAKIASTQAPSSPLAATWTPPAGMPAHGEVGALSGADRIPATGFAARDGAVYLPPAALVPHPPALPLLVFMMGQPGSPDPTTLARTLDAFAATHRGLAPIAIVADQLGGPTLDPACADSATYGAVATYFTTDIPAFARQRLNVIDDPAYWVIGGYSNGGSCALLWGSAHPTVYGQIMDISGNEFPGSETVDRTVQDVFAGNRAAFEQAKPTAVMARNAGAYDGHHAVFTSGSDDNTYGPGQRANADAARAAGFTVTAIIIPGAGHVGDALDQGLAEAIAALGQPLGMDSG